MCVFIFVCFPLKILGLLLQCLFLYLEMLLFILFLSLFINITIIFFNSFLRSDTSVFLRMKEMESVLSLKHQWAWRNLKL